MMASRLACAALLFAIGCGGAPSPSAPVATSSATLRVSNADLIWDGNPAGYAPWCTDAAEPRCAAIRKQGPAAIPGLIEALSDPDRFVAAHVLLTQLARVRYQAFPRWNGLELRLHGDGGADIDPRQRFILQERWRRWANETPHPSVLPPQGGES
jgi:hypothetical protein